VRATTALSFDAREAFDAREVVERDVELAQVLHMAQILELRDDVVLELEDLDFAAEAAEDGLDALNLELVERELLEVREEAVVVLRLPADELFCDDDHFDGEGGRKRGDEECRTQQLAANCAS
jgi:hypothetical protein